MSNILVLPFPLCCVPSRRHLHSPLRSTLIDIDFHYLHMPSSTTKGEIAMAEVIKELKEMNAEFQIDKYLSSGSYGAVCAGRDGNGLPVAIKRVFTTVSDGKTVTIMSDSFLGKRVLREVKLLSHFQHNNILGLRDIMVNMEPKGKEKLYLVTDLMRTDLAQVIADPKITITPEHIRFFMYHILLGLHALHEAGVVHRDLHPGNVLVADSNEIKICDFNLAREDTPGDDKTHYVTHRWYRAPELVMQFKSFTKKVDIWSAGCVMAELFNRKAVFRGSTFYNQLNKIVEVVGTPNERDVAMFSSQSARDYLKATLGGFRPKPWRDVCPGADEEALNLLSKLLAFNPAHRITADEALRHPYFKSMLIESELSADLAPPFHFNEAMTDVVDMHHMFVEIAKEFQVRREQRKKRQAEGADDEVMLTPGVKSQGSSEGDDETAQATMEGHVPRSGSFLSLTDQW